MDLEGKSDVLFYSEIESYIEHLSYFSLDQIGSMRWRLH